MNQFYPFYPTQLRCDYELDINIEVVRRINDDYPTIYKARWITNDKGPIVLIEKNDIPSEHEQLFYTAFKKHPHIVRTFGYVGNDRGTTMILQERAPHGNLQSLLTSGRFQPTEPVLMEIFRQVIDTMMDVVGAGLVHGDLRCENILVFKMHPTDPKQNEVKLSNFSLAHRDNPSVVDDRRLNIPVRYCALEILRSAGRSNYSQYSDVYSMVVLMWQAFSKGKVPYESVITNGEVRQRKLNQEKLPKPLNCTKNIWSIMEVCWLNEPSVRYEFNVLKAVLSAISPDSMEVYRYELNKDIKQKRCLPFGNGRFYDAEWILKKKSPIIILALNETAEYEASLHLELDGHPHIISTFGLVRHGGPSILLVQERAAHSDLQRLLQSGDFNPSLEVLISIFSKIVEAMIYITNAGIVHGDLRCSNILMFDKDEFETNRNIVKVTNFSMARKKIYEQVLATETVLTKDQLYHSEYFDVYSMGVLMWEVLVNERLPPDYHSNKENFSRPLGCSELLWTIIQGCLSQDLTVRYNFEGLKETFSKDHITIVPSVRCEYCHHRFPEDEIEDHQQTCPPLPPPSPPPATINTKIHDTYLPIDTPVPIENDIVLPPWYEPPPSQTPQDEHQLRTSHVPTPQEPIFISCERSNEQIRTDRVATHRSEYQGSIPSPPKTVECSRCHQSIPLNQLDVHEADCESEPPTKSFFDRLRSCLCFRK